MSTDASTPLIAPGYQAQSVDVPEERLAKLTGLELL
jgi:hypothetical protein